MGGAPREALSHFERAAELLSENVVVLAARVESLGWGVGEGDVDTATGLPKAHQGSGGWLAPAQRFPVQLVFDAAAGRPQGVRYSARASVILYTGEHPIANALAWVWIRLIAILTYVS